MAYTTPSCMHMALLQLQALISIGLLLASMSSGSAEEAPSGYGIELIHVDANGGFTREDQLIHRVVDRSADITDGDDTPASSSSGTDGPHLRDYLMKLKIGKAPASLVVLDTGSDLVLTKRLELCKRSASFTPVNCYDPDNRVTCDGCIFGLCMFDRKFGDANKDATGFIGNQTLTFDNAKKDYNVSIACAIDNDKKLMPKSAKGIVGLNRGNMSLVRQLNLADFSYCLSDKHSTRLWLGDGYDVLAKYPDKLQTTPLVHVETIPDTSVWANMYYVKLEAISIGGKHWHLPDTTKVDEKGVMMLDSGHSSTKLEKSVFKKLKDLLEEKYEKTENHEERTCFRSKDGKEPEGPEMVLYFAKKRENNYMDNYMDKEPDGARMHLPWANYMDKEADGSGTKFCLAILENQGEHFQGSILGTFPQINTYMHYDLKKEDEKLSFVPDFDCSQP